MNSAEKNLQASIQTIEAAIRRGRSKRIRQVPIPEARALVEALADAQAHLVSLKAELRSLQLRAMQRATGCRYASRLN